MNACRRTQLGLTLIEVLVSMVIAAFGLLGLAALQARSLSMQIDSESRRVAASLVSQLRERVTANQEGYGQALATQYTRTLLPGSALLIPSCANPDACTATAEVPSIQIALWLTEVRRQLPEAAVRIGPTTAGSAASMTVTIGWLEPNANAVANDAACDAITAVRTNPRYRCVTATLFPG
jgi:type IV pilus assembly protein PilV